MVESDLVFSFQERRNPVMVIKAAGRAQKSSYH
jgi:hypothetical protein